MNTPSRMMPPAPAPQKATIAGWLFLAGLLACIAWGLATDAPSRWIFGGASTLIVALTALGYWKQKRIVAERKEESICSFSRALPANQHDTWVVRAVYEELSLLARAPLRPSDDIKKFWGIDGDDLDDVAFRIAHRARRSMDDAQKNPMFDRVVTIEDMILFFEQQPKLPEPQEPAAFSARSPESLA